MSPIASVVVYIYNLILVFYTLEDEKRPLVKRVEDAERENESSMSEEIMDGNHSLEGLPAKDLLKRFHILQGERVETYALFEEYVFMLYINRYKIDIVHKYINFYTLHFILGRTNLAIRTSTSLKIQRFVKIFVH